MRLIDADALTAWMIGELRMIPNGVFNAMTGRQAANLIGMSIDEAPTVEMPGWISVKDRLPEEKGLYLVYDGDSVFASEYVPGREEGEWTEDIEEYLTFEVTHWMPLPEPPEEVSGDA